MPCPICRSAPSPRYRPFCSRRCADIDLGRWITGGYRLPSPEEPGESEPLDGPGSGAGDRH